MSNTTRSLPVSTWPYGEATGAVQNSDPRIFTDENLSRLKETVFAAYEAQGFARELIGEWAISENDVADFLELARAAAPKRILEVGTYVGVSTMMLAHVCPVAEIFTVDPDFPLSKEMSAVGSSMEISSESATHHAIARVAAEHLGFSDRIHFFKGGFSVGDTFASSLGDDSSKVEVVGPALCAAHGPFDFVFIDGLHTSQAVLKDLELSVDNITAGAPIVLHDCIGFWGPSVRSGIFEFLRRRQDYTFVHPRYADVYRSIGVVRERANSRISVRKPAVSGVGLKSAVAAIAKGVFGDASITEIAASKPYFDDGSKVIALFNATKAKSSVADAMIRSKADKFVAIEAMDLADDALLSEIYSAVAAIDGTILLGATPPGEDGVAGPHSRPLSRAFDLASSFGLSLFLGPFTEHEHARYSLLPEPRALGHSSMLLSFLVATKNASYRDAGGREYVRLTEQLAREHEQAELQRVHLAAAYRRHFTLARNEHRIRLESDAAYAKETAELRSLWAAANNTVKQEQESRATAVAELTRAIDDQRAEVDRLRKYAAELQSSHASAIAEQTRISAQLAASNQQTRELMANLVASYETIDAIEGELTIQSQLLGGATAAPIATKFDEHTQDSTAALAMVRRRSQHISQAFREIVDAAIARGPSVLGELPATLEELSAQHARLHSEIERIRRSLPWRVLGIYRVPRRFIARLIGR